MQKIESGMKLERDWKTNKWELKSRKSMMKVAPFLITY